MYKHILLPTDGSERSERAIQAGVQLAKVHGAQVTCICVTEATYISEIDAGGNPLADSRLAKFKAACQAESVAYECVTKVGGAPHESIVRCAEELGCDLIVMATHARSRVGKFFLGSVASTVLSECDIPVLLYR